MFDEYLLDSGCTTHIYRTDLPEVADSKDLPCDVTGIEGNARKGHKGMHPIFEQGIVLSSCPMNLLSLSQLHKQGFKVEYKRKTNEFVVQKEINGKQHNIHFKCYKRLYRAQLPRAASSTISIVEPKEVGLASRIQTRGIFNDEQTNRAKQIRDIHHQLGHPSNSVLSALLDNNSIIGIDLTSRDVENSRLLFGKCKGCMLGKTTNKKMPTSNSEHTDIIGKILHMDIIYFGEITKKQLYLLTIDEATGYITLHYMKDRSSDTLVKVVSDAITIYRAYGRITSKVCADSETGITAIKDKLAFFKIEMIQNSAGEHEKRSERMVRTIREKSRSLAFSLPFALPSMLNYYLINFIVQSINLTPNVHTKHRCPVTLITGNKIKKEQIELTFGDIVNCPIVKPSEGRRTETLLVVGRDLSSTTYICMNLATKKLVRRRRYEKDKSNNINILQLIEKWGNGINYDFTKPILEELRDDTVTNTNDDDVEIPNVTQVIQPDHVIDFNINPPTPTTKVTTPQTEINIIPTSHPIVLHPTPLSLPPLSSPIANTNEYHHQSTAASPLPSPAETINTTNIIANNNINNRSKRKTKVTNTLTFSNPTSIASSNSDHLHVPAERIHNTRINPKKKLIMELSGNKATDNWSNKIASNVSSTTANNIDNDETNVNTIDTDAMFNDTSMKQSRNRQPKKLKPKFKNKHIRYKNKKIPHIACMTLRDGMKINPSATIAATVSEIKQMFEKGVFYPIKTKDIGDNQVIRSSLIITLKPSKTKARLVASGNMQNRNLYNSSEISSATARTASIMSLIAISANTRMKISTADITGAYLNATLPTNNKVVMKIQKDIAKIIVDEMPELKPFLDFNGAMYVKVVRAIYGLIESGALWNQHLTDTLIKLGHQQLKTDGCIFKKENSKTGKRTFIGVYVDDLLICCEDENDRIHLIKELEKIYGAMKTNNDYHLIYRGLEIKQSKDLTYTTVSQIEYTKELIKESGITGTARTPCTSTFLSDNSKNKITSKPAIDPAAYGRTIAKLNWLATQSRVDIRLAVSQLSRSIHAPTINDESKLKRVIRYLNGSINKGLCYKKSNIKIKAYADASHLVYDDCRGQSGILIYIGDSIIDSSSKRQNITAQSSTEAELISLSSTVNSVLWTKHLLEELGFPQQECIIYQDNQSCIQMGQTGKLTNRTKHLGMRYFNVYDNYKLKNIALEYTPAENMRADFLTKPLGPSMFTAARDNVMIDINDREERNIKE